MGDVFSHPHSLLVHSIATGSSGSREWTARYRDGNLEKESVSR